MKNSLNKLVGASLISSAIALTGCVGQADKTLWISDDDGDLGYVDLDTGTVTVVGNMGVVITDIAFDSAGNLYGISFSDLYSIDKETAAITLIGSHTNDSGAKNSLVFDKDGTLYAAWDALYTIDVATGMSNLVGNGGVVYRSSGDLAFHKGDLYMTGLDFDGTGDELLVMDTATGGGTEVGVLSDEQAFYGLSSNGSKLYTVQNTKVFSVDETSAAVTEVVDYVGQGLGVAYGSAFESEAK